MAEAVEGLGSLTRRLNRVERDVPRAARRARMESGEDLLTKTIPVTPLECGPLRESGYVEHAESESVVGFGGQAAGYAIFVHERLELRHAPPTRSKFLEATALENMDRYRAHIVNAAKGTV